MTDASLEEQPEDRPRSEYLQDAVIPEHAQLSFGGGLEQTGRPLLTLLDAQVRFLLDDRGRTGR